MFQICYSFFMCHKIHKIQAIINVFFQKWQKRNPAPEMLLTFV